MTHKTFYHTSKWLQMVFWRNWFQKWLLVSRHPHSRLRQKRQDLIIQEKNGELQSSFDGAKTPKVTTTESEIKVNDFSLRQWHGLHIYMLAYLYSHMFMWGFMYIRERVHLILRQLTGASVIEVLFSKNIQRNGISEYFLNTTHRPSGPSWSLDMYQHCC